MLWKENKHMKEEIIDKITEKWKGQMWGTEARLIMKPLLVATSLGDSSLWGSRKQTKRGESSV